MALSPAPRARRAVNTDATPTIPEHETQCRLAFRANKTKNAATSEEKKHVAAAWKAMSAINMNTFTFVEGNQTVDAIIGAADPTDEVSIEKLYGLVTAGTITMPQFLGVIKASCGAVKDAMGSNVLSMVVVSKASEVKLSIKARK